MRLIKVEALLTSEEDVFEDYNGPLDSLPYAVLSHRWTDTEITFDHVRKGLSPDRVGIDKLISAARQADHDGIPLLWLDTCCIDKGSSSEVSEAINSMYNWYKHADRCYVYLHDVDAENPERAFTQSTWFTRGWTLQELLAPEDVVFYDRYWRRMGNKQSLHGEIVRVTGIDEKVLRTRDLSGSSVAQKMSWAARRTTTRLEDAAYCLMGLFDVNMPLIYGEGEKAFLRLQEEIIKTSDDHSIFAWEMDTMINGLLAPTPAAFAHGGQLEPYRPVDGGHPFFMTNRGLSVTLKTTPWTTDVYLACLDVVQKPDNSGLADMRLGIFLRRIGEGDQFARIKFNGHSAWTNFYHIFEEEERPVRERPLYVRNIIDAQGHEDWLPDTLYGFRISNDMRRPTSSVNYRGHWRDWSVTTSPGEWGLMISLDLSRECMGLKQITLGVDFDFNPVCVLEDSSTETTVQPRKTLKLKHWSRLFYDKYEWTDVVRGTAFRRSSHDGLWILHGHREHGLNVVLFSDDYGSDSILVQLKREVRDCQRVWEVSVETIGGMFANPAQAHFQQHWGSRQNFQECQGLGISDADLEQGSQILSAMYDQVTPVLDGLEPIAS